MPRFGGGNVLGVCADADADGAGTFVLLAGAAEYCFGDGLRLDF